MVSRILQDPLVWDDLEDGYCDRNASIGNWSGHNSGINFLKINQTNQRTMHSQYNAVGNFGPTNNYLCLTKNDVTDDMFFTSYWYKLSDNFVWNTTPTSGAANNIKHWRVWPPGATSNSSKHTFTYHGFGNHGQTWSDNPSVWRPPNY